MHVNGGIILCQFYTRINKIVGPAVGIGIHLGTDHIMGADQLHTGLMNLGIIIHRTVRHTGAAQQADPPLPGGASQRLLHCLGCARDLHCTTDTLAAGDNAFSSGKFSAHRLRNSFSVPKFLFGTHMIHLQP